MCISRATGLAVALLLAACAEPPAPQEPLAPAPGLRVAKMLRAEADEAATNAFAERLGSAGARGSADRNSSADKSSSADKNHSADTSGSVEKDNHAGENGDGSGFAEALSPRSFQFPADHGAHPAYRNEWWYLTCALKSAGGSEFGVQFTLFRRALFPQGDAKDPWRNGQAYLAHFAVTDVHSGVHRAAERLARGHPALSGTVVEGTAVRAFLEDWRLDMGPAAWTLNATVDGLAAALELRPSKPPVLQGEAGLSRKGPRQASYYYSVPRLQVSGHLQIDGVRHFVDGLGWFDREWSTSALSPGQVGWDWFALMLDSGHDLMVFQLRRQDGARDAFDHGAWIDPSGQAHPLTAEDFTLTPLRYWRDDEGAEWPIGWRLQLPDRHFEIRASLEDQRMDTLFTYWEGLVEVLDEEGRGLGRGYMELTGY